MFVVIFLIISKTLTFANLKCRFIYRFVISLHDVA